MKGRVHDEPVGSGPKGFASVLTRNDLRALRGFYFIPSDFRITLFGPGGRIDRPLEGCLGVFEEALKPDLCFFLHKFIVQLMNVYRLSPV